MGLSEFKLGFFLFLFILYFKHIDEHIFRKKEEDEKEEQEEESKICDKNFLCIRHLQIAR